MAYATLGVAQSNMGNSNVANESLKKAYDLRERASELEKFYIQGHYYDIVTGDQEKAAELYDQWTRTYPHQSTVPWDNLSLSYQTLGEYDKALAAANEAMRIDPKDNFANQHLAAIYMYMNRFDEAKAVSETAKAAKVDAIGVHFALQGIAFLQGDPAVFQRESAWGNGKAIEAFFVFRVGMTQDAVGKIKLSRQTSQHAMELAKQHGLSELPGNVIANQALRDLMHGYAESARQKAAELPHLPGDINPRAGAAMTFAQLGDSAQAQKNLDELLKLYPEDTTVKYVVVPFVQAHNLLHKNKPEEAIAALEAGRKYELGEMNSFFSFQIIYARGIAYLQLKDGAKAAIEFQKILDHRGVNPFSSIPPVAQLQLARAYAPAGRQR